MAPLLLAMCGGIVSIGLATWRPSYVYADSVDSTDSAPAVVSTCAGVGKVP
jgi:pectate lyase